MTSPNGYGSERGSWGFPTRKLLAVRRYSYYATGEREPNLATLVRICEVLAATPNDLLLPGASAPAVSARDRLLTRISAATGNLTDAQLEIAACQIECLTAYPAPVRRAARRRS